MQKEKLSLIQSMPCQLSDTTRVSFCTCGVPLSSTDSHGKDVTCRQSCLHILRQVAQQGKLLEMTEQPGQSMSKTGGSQACFLQRL